MESRIFLVLLVLLIVVDHSAGQRIRNSCRRNKWMCRSIRRCIRQSQVCDGVPNCFDHSDEYNCPGFQCPRGRFHCNDGPCINPNWRCDNYRDCTDGSDEANCPPRK